MKKSSKLQFLVMYLVFQSCLLVVGTSHLHAQTEAKPMDNEDVIRMTRAGLGEDVIITAIKSRSTSFDVSVDGLIKLKAAKVGEGVILEMQRAKPASTSVAARKGSAGNQDSASTKRSVQSNPAGTGSDVSYGSLNDISGFKKVFVYADDVDSRNRVLNELDDSDYFEVVGNADEAEFILEYETIGENRSDVTLSDGSISRKGQLTAYFYSTGTKVIVWQKSSVYKKMVWGLIKNSKSEKKLTKEFVSDVRKGR